MNIISESTLWYSARRPWSQSQWSLWWISLQSFGGGVGAFVVVVVLFVVVVGFVVVVVVLLVVVVVGLRVVVVLGGSVGPEVGTAVMLEYSAFQICSS